VLIVIFLLPLKALFFYLGEFIKLGVKRTAGA